MNRLSEISLDLNYHFHIWIDSANKLLSANIIHNMQGNVNVIQSPYFFQRPNSPKGTLNHNSSSKNVSLSLSIGANQNPQQLIPFQKMKSI